MTRRWRSRAPRTQPWILRPRPRSPTGPAALRSGANSSPGPGTSTPMSRASSPTVSRRRAPTRRCSWRRSPYSDAKRRSRISSPSEAGRTIASRQHGWSSSQRDCSWRRAARSESSTTSCEPPSMPSSRTKGAATSTHGSLVAGERRRRERHAAAAGVGSQESSGTRPPATYPSDRTVTHAQAGGPRRAAVDRRSHRLGAGRDSAGARAARRTRILGRGARSAGACYGAMVAHRRPTGSAA
jgi:hypothetical protein